MEWLKASMPTAKNAVAEPLEIPSGRQTLGYTLWKPNVSLPVPVVRL